MQVEQTENPEQPEMGVPGMGPSLRDQSVKQKELEGSITFKIYKNDKTLESMKKLIELKTIISK